MFVVSLLLWSSTARGVGAVVVVAAARVVLVAGMAAESPGRVFVVTAAGIDIQEICRPWSQEKRNCREFRRRNNNNIVPEASFSAPAISGGH